MLENMSHHGKLLDELETKTQLQPYYIKHTEKLNEIDEVSMTEILRNYRAIEVNEDDQRAIWNTLTSDADEMNEQTCGWLRQRLKSHNESHLVWLDGAAGTGKSVLAAHLAEFLSRDNHVVIRHFCDERHSSSTKYDQILNSITRQLLQVSVDAITYAYEISINECKPQAIPTLEDFVRELVAIVSRSLQDQQMIWIIVDGINACDDKARLMNLILEKIGGSHQQSCNVLFTSRDKPPSEGVGKNFIVSLGGEQDHMDSIRFYTRKRLILVSGRFSEFGVGVDDLVPLGVEIVKKSHGQF